MRHPGVCQDVDDPLAGPDWVSGTDPVSVAFYPVLYSSPPTDLTAAATRRRPPLNASTASPYGLEKPNLVVGCSGGGPGFPASVRLDKS